MFQGFLSSHTYTHAPNTHTVGNLAGPPFRIHSHTNTPKTRTRALALACLDILSSILERAVCCSSFRVVCFSNVHHHIIIDATTMCETGNRGSLISHTDAMVNLYIVPVRATLLKLGLLLFQFLLPQNTHTLSRGVGLRDRPPVDGRMMFGWGRDAAAATENVLLDLETSIEIYSRLWRRFSNCPRDLLVANGNRLGLLFLLLRLLLSPQGSNSPYLGLALVNILHILLHPTLQFLLFMLSCVNSCFSSLMLFVFFKVKDSSSVQCMFYS